MRIVLMEILDAKIETATASALAKAKPTKRTPADSNQPSANAPTLAAHRGDQLTLENRRFRLGYEVCERNKAAERHVIPSTGTHTHSHKYIPLWAYLSDTDCLRIIILNVFCLPHRIVSVNKNRQMEESEAGRQMVSRRGMWVTLRPPV